MTNYKHYQRTMKYSSSTIPSHVAIIMDGNGRWARNRKMPRFSGHKAGVETVKKIVEYTAKHQIKILTLFAFSSENWKRPDKEVNLLMELLLTSLKNEVDRLHDENIRIKFIGDRKNFNNNLVNKIYEAEEHTKENDGLRLIIAANYGGRWDIVQAAKKIGEEIESGNISSRDIDESVFSEYLELNQVPDPDLFIRSGGEMRISNFLLWNLAYTELYFTETLWPDFKNDEFENALKVYAKRQRRFGKTSEQLRQAQDA